jgi:hypothetical protein
MAFGGGWITAKSVHPHRQGLSCKITGKIYFENASYKVILPCT